MNIVSDFNRCYQLHSLNQEIAIKSHWTFDSKLCDYVVTELEYLEEINIGAYLVNINDVEFWIPSTWNVLVTDYDTFQLDTVPISTCATTPHDIILFEPNYMSLITQKLTIKDYDNSKQLIYPTINKSKGMMHYAGIYKLNSRTLYTSIMITPYDLHRYLKTRVVGDLFE